jgi:hypothetical protein
MPNGHSALHELQPSWITRGHALRPYSRAVLQLEPAKFVVADRYYAANQGLPSTGPEASEDPETASLLDRARLLPRRSSSAFSYYATNILASREWPGSALYLWPQQLHAILRGCGLTVTLPRVTKAEVVGILSNARRSVRHDIQSSFLARSAAYLQVSELCMAGNAIYNLTVKDARGPLINPPNVLDNSSSADHGRLPTERTLFDWAQLP